MSPSLTDLIKDFIINDLFEVGWGNDGNYVRLKWIGEKWSCVCCQLCGWGEEHKYNSWIDIIEHFKASHEDVVNIIVLGYC